MVTQMATYRNNLPQAGKTLMLTDSGLETTLIFHDGLDLPAFAAYPLMETPEGRDPLIRTRKYLEMRKAWDDKKQASLDERAATITNEIVAGTAPGGELGGTWASPTVDATHSGSAHHSAVTVSGTARARPRHAAASGDRGWRFTSAASSAAAAWDQAGG